MLIRETVAPPDDETDTVPALKGALVSWSHDVAQSLRGMHERPLPITLPLNDRRMGYAMAALMAVMLFVCMMAFLLHFMLGHVAQGFDSSLQNSMTFEILPTAEAGKDGKAPDQRAALLEERLRKIPGIISVKKVEPQKIADLLEPWLGPTADMAQLPLPVLIDVRLQPGATIDKTALQRAAEGLEGAALDDHQKMAQELARFEKRMKGLASAIITLALFALALTAYFAAQANFYMNRSMIEILHLIGAEDHAIAGHTGFQLLRLALLASAVAFTGALLTLLGLWVSGRGLDLSFLPQLAIGMGDWLLLIIFWALLGAGAVLLCLVVSRVTVLRSLRTLL